MITIHGRTGRQRDRVLSSDAGISSAVDEWERRMRTEAVDVNSKGRPCRERMLVCLLRRPSPSFSNKGAAFKSSEAKAWDDLCVCIGDTLRLPVGEIEVALGPEPPELPAKIEYGPRRESVFLDGRRFPLCLNESDATFVQDALLGAASSQRSVGVGQAVPLACDRGRPSIFGGKFARSVTGVLAPGECEALLKITNAAGYGLAGSRGFNPFARFAMRCLVDAPAVAAALTERLRSVLPPEYPPGSGRPLVGVNDRLRFLKYLPGMHHSGDHTDCAHEDPERGRSFLTIQVYLNDSFTGGRTTFISDKLVPIEPTVGAAVVFDHELYHRGGMVTSGTKFAVRLDVCYGHADASDKPGKRSPAAWSYYEEENWEAKNRQSGGAYPAQTSRRGRWNRSHN
eukprot:TRINITY_DN23277_c0_g1_i3.p1 TRINITY_DN23277_c0_g1~~TRINITY_DN23277_c0_g1_i3.p1  ORF type:complete len:398 (+),score=44.72 TRINITY_DN23277_c0_g1_i3:134-1327(+)